MKKQPVDSPFRDHSWTALVILLLAILAAFWGMTDFKPPRALPVAAPRTEFSAFRAVKYLERIARKPHPMGTEEHDIVRDFLAETLRDLGYEPQIQTVVYVEPERQSAGRIHNIVAKLSGSHPTGKSLMLCSHYDSPESSPGAADAGAGVAAILESARALKTGAPPNEDIVFLLTDAEEDNLQGAKAFVQEHPWFKDVGLVLNFEAGGSRGICRMLETSRGNSRLIREFVKAVPFPWASSFTTSVVPFIPHNTDLKVFMSAGAQGMIFAFAEGDLNFHTPQDSVPNLSLDSLQHLGTYALSLARHFGQHGIPEKSGEDAIFFNLPGAIFVHYSQGIALGILALIVIMGAAAGILGFKKKILKSKFLFAALPLLLIQLVMAAILALLFRSAVVASHRSWLPPGPYYANRFYLLAIIFLIFTGSITFFALTFKRIGWENAAYAAGLILAALAIALTVRFPGASYLIAWPAALLLLDLLLSFILQNRSSAPITKAVAAGLAALPTALLGAPMIYLLFIATRFTVPLVIALAVFTSLFLCTFIPVYGLLGRHRRTVWALLASGSFLALAAAGTLTTKYTERHPRWMTLDYWLDLDSRTASWLTTNRAPKELIREIMPQARSGHPMDIPPYRSATYLNGTAPFVNLEPPTLDKQEDIVQDGIRTLRFHLSSPRISRELMVFGGETQVISAEVAGKPVMDAQSGRQRLVLWLPNPGKEGFTLSLKVKAGAPVSLMVRERLLGLPEEAGKVLPSPPATIFLKTSTTIRKTFAY